MSNGGPGFGSAIIPGLDISGGIPGVGSRRAQEQQQKSMLSTLLGVDMSGMSEQGINFSQSLRDHLVNSLTNGEENFTYDDFVQGVIGLQDFIVRDKKTYAENLSVAQPILNASVNDATYASWKAELEKAGKYMSQEAVQQYAADFDRMLENPYPGNFFNPSDMMLFADDPALAMRNMMPAAGMNILGAEMPQQNAFQYELEDLPTGDVFAYMKSGAESNLLSLLGGVDNEADAKQKIAQHYNTYVLGVGPGRRALQESFAGQSYFIQDLADKLVGFEGVDPAGMAEYLLTNGDPLGRQFESNNESFYKQFEEYYMDIFKAKQREDAATAANRSGQKDPKYQFEANLVKVPMGPDIEVLRSNLANSDMIGSLPRGIISGSPLDMQEENNLLTSIQENGFLHFSDRSEITIPSQVGSDLPDLNVTSLGVAKYGENIYLILSGDQKEDVLKTTSIDPGPEADVVEVIPGADGESFGTEYVVRTGQVDKDFINAYSIQDDVSMNYLEALGNKYLKSVDVTKVDLNVADQTNFNTTLGMSILIRKMANAIDPNGDRVFSDQDILDAQANINQAKIKF